VLTVRTGRGDAGADARASHRRRVTTGVVASTVLMSSGALVIFPLLPALQAALVDPMRLIDPP
jgi:hypothetical protein